MDRRILKRSIRCCRSRDIENDYYLRNLGDPRQRNSGNLCSLEEAVRMRKICARKSHGQNDLKYARTRCTMSSREFGDQESQTEFCRAHKLTSGVLSFAILRRSRNIIVRGNIRLSLRNSLFTDASISVVRIAKFRDLSFSFPRFANNI